MRVAPAAAAADLKFSIITPSFNQAAFLEETLRSVLDQRLPALQYIVIDGGSTDGSVEILRRYGPRLDHWESEPDRGQVHAINKGLARATGDVIAFLNSDDVYLPGALAAVAAHFEARPESTWVSGDVIMFGQQGWPTTLVQSRPPASVGHALAWSYKAPQPGMFWRKALLSAGFDERWRYCFDHELYLRLLLAGHRCDHLEVPLAAYRLHPESKTVAEHAAMDHEFDLIAEQYEERVGGRARRWSVAIRRLRESYAASGRGERAKATSLVLRALATRPQEICDRAFWGCLRRALAPSGSAHDTT